MVAPIWAQAKSSTVSAKPNWAARYTPKACSFYPVIWQRIMSGASGDIGTSFCHFSSSFIVADLNSEPFNDDVSAQTLFRAARAPIVLPQTGDEAS
jgi:hypothetical protein